MGLDRILAMITWYVSVNKGMPQRDATVAAIHHKGGKGKGKAKGKGKGQSRAEGNRERESGAQSESVECRCCGLRGHFKRDCKWLHEKCRVCQKPGHLQKVCRARKSTSAQAAQQSSEHPEQAPEPSTNLVWSMFVQEDGGNDVWTMMVGDAALPIANTEEWHIGSEDEAQAEAPVPVDTQIDRLQGLSKSLVDAIIRTTLAVQEDGLRSDDVSRSNVNTMHRLSRSAKGLNRSSRVCVSGPVPLLKCRRRR